MVGPAVPGASHVAICRPQLLLCGAKPVQTDSAEHASGGHHDYARHDHGLRRPCQVVHAAAFASS
eukprot:1808570-Alexandrium_andersonii.AAC.1